MHKELQRKEFIQKRKNVSSKEKWDFKIKEQLLSNQKIMDAENILIYVSKEDEVDTLMIIVELLKCKKVYVPKVEDNIISFYRINSLEELKKGAFNILEPIGNKKLDDYKNSVIIVPGIAFDRKNNRIGYGKGYYDKFLSNKKIYKIGLSYPPLIVEKIKTEIYDIKMDIVITGDD